jgi:hypothetical protein
MDRSAHINKIVSGGQTGADRSALNFAMMHAFAQGGWCPKGRKAEDRPIDTCYALTETPSADYLQRTEWNVRDRQTHGVHPRPWHQGAEHCRQPGFEGARGRPFRERLVVGTIRQSRALFLLPRDQRRRLESIEKWVGLAARSIVYRLAFAAEDFTRGLRAGRSQPRACLRRLQTAERSGAEPPRPVEPPN